MTDRKWKHFLRGLHFNVIRAYLSTRISYNALIEASFPHMDVFSPCFAGVFSRMGSFLGTCFKLSSADDMASVSVYKKSRRNTIQTLLQVKLIIVYVHVRVYNIYSYMDILCVCPRAFIPCQTS